jgi:aminoglycoside phosphotransferase (APT) family kinase protein
MQNVSEILKDALPDKLPLSVEPLPGGATNLNYKVCFGGDEPAVVLRLYTRGLETARLELDLLRAAAGYLPVPEIVHAGDGFLIYRFIEGATFQELKSTGTAQDMAGASYAIGMVLARVRRVRAAGPPPRVFAREWLDSPLLAERMGIGEMKLLRDLVTAWWPRIAPLAEEKCLVHGDFNNRNTLVRRDGGRWIVSGVLDWERAFTGSPLWDAARFICYEKSDRPLREPHFSNGFCDGGGKLPEDWNAFSRVLNVVSAAESLSRPDLPRPFIPELRELVVSMKV